MIKFEDIKIGQKLVLWNGDVVEVVDFKYITGIPTIVAETKKAVYSIPAMWVIDATIIEATKTELIYE